MYFFIHSQAYICRAKLRLGHFDPQEFKKIIEQLEDNKFLDLNYLYFVMDFG